MLSVAELLNERVIALLAEFISFYKGTKPSRSLIRSYLERRNDEKNIVFGSNRGLLTQDEVCNLVLANVMMEFVGGDVSVDPAHAEASRSALHALLFEIP